jgi:3'-phosphoadenosine 5'-phosphosulfate sulfotransferase (PAPS reductase)/FAD synthetase
MDTHSAIFQHAPRVALQFSGGRDSLALLLLMRGHWSRLTVYHCDSGDAYPETRALVARVRELVPNFVEVAGAVHETHARFGWPSDVLQAGAVWHWPQQIAGHLPLIDRHYCCMHSLMLPMHQRMQQDGITLVLRGQRDSDEPKSHVRHGETVDGMTIGYPIADWTTREVDAFIQSQGWDVPPYYGEGLTSAPDCMHCTAWLEHGAYGYLSKHHPAQAAVVYERLARIRVTVQPFLNNLDAALNAPAQAQET